MMSAQSQDRLFDLLKHYASKLKALIVILEKEHDSLDERNIKALEQCTEKKQELLNEISMLEQERDSLNQCIEIDTDKLKADKNFTQLNDQIKTLLNKCRHMNEENGAIIEISSQFNQRMLEIMIGIPEQGDLYDAAGKNATKLSNQSVARI